MASTGLLSEGLLSGGMLSEGLGADVLGVCVLAAGSVGMLGASAAVLVTRGLRTRLAAGSPASLVGSDKWRILA